MMSEHKNLTKDEVKALMKHGFPTGTPSQLSDSFVFGMRYGKTIDNAAINENQRLTEIATKHATRADELHEALEMCIEALERSYDATEWPADGSSQQEVTAVQCREVLNRTKIDAVSNSNDD